MKRARTRVCFVTHALGRGGTERHLIELVSRLDPGSIEPLILCLGPDVYSPSFASRPEVGVVVLQPRPSSTFAFWRVFRAQRANVIVFVNGMFGLFPWYALLAARLAGVRRVVAIEQLEAEPAPDRRELHPGVLGSLRRAFGWHARDLWRKRLSGWLAETSICVSDAVRRRLIEDYGYPASHTVRIWNAIDLKRFGVPTGLAEEVRGALGCVRGQPIVACVCMLNRLKRIDVVLDAMALVVKTNPDCRCVIVGDGKLEAEMRLRAQDLGLQKHVCFVGRVDDVRPYLEIADLYVTASEREGLPLSVAEAMAYALPCVATDIGPHREMIRPGVDGVLVPTGSVDGLATAISTLLENRGDRESIGRAARARAQEDFDVDRMSERTQRVLLGFRED